MIPSLYVANETNFDKIGLGMLPDCTSCIVTEERNGVYELEFSYPITGVNYQELSPDRIVKAKPNERSEPQLFRIYRNSKPLNGIVKFYAQHISYDLNTMVVLPFTLKGVPAQAALKRILSDCIATESRPNRFVPGTVTVGSGTVEIKEPTPARKCLGGMEGSLLDRFRGEYEFDNFTVHYYESRGQDSGVTILYGKNLTDITADTNIADTYTSVCPYYRNDDGTVETLINGNIRIDSETIITLKTAPLIILDEAENYGSERTLVLDMTDRFGENEKFSQKLLYTKTQSYIQSNKPQKIKQNIEISFAQLWQSEEYKNVALLERVGLCDTVTVKYEALGVSAKAKVIKTVYDVLKEKYVKMELGDVRSNFGATLLKLNENLGDLANTSVNKSAMQRAIENATRLITGAEGGYVYISNRINAKGDILDGIEQNQELEFEDEKPGEILIMDKPNINSANRMWRWNLGGLGYSKNGYNGPYETAITMDGAIVANFITAGELNAGIITTGILTDQYGVNYWNLETGEFRLTTNTKIKGIGYGNEKTLSEYVTEKANSATVSASEANKLAAKFEQEFLEQEKIFNALTDNGRAKGIYLTPDGELYINGTFIKAGSISGNLIRSGVIQSPKGDLTIDLTNEYLEIISKNNQRPGSIVIGNDGFSLYNADNKATGQIFNTRVYHATTHTTEILSMAKMDLCEFKEAEIKQLTIPSSGEIIYHGYNLSFTQVLNQNRESWTVLGYKTSSG
jgi:phage minor structural protein